MTPTHGSVAKRVREDKEAHPENYCWERRCLWNLRSGVCPSHGHPFELANDRKGDKA